LTGTSSSRPPRILFVDHAAVLGGAELSLLDIATAMRGRAAVALFEDGPFAEALVRAGVGVIPVSAGSGLKAAKKDSRVPSLSAWVAAARATVALARSARPFDLLYANSPKSFLISVAAGVLARRPVVWHLRDILDPQHFSRSNVQLLIRAANVRAARIVANSHATADAFVSAGGRRDIVRVVHNGIDAAPFDRLAPSARADARRELGIAETDFVVGSFSRLHPWKGQRVLLDALETLPGVHALIVGGALFSGEAEFETELRDRAARVPLAGRVHLLGARREVPRLIAACDVVVHSSIWPEPFGRVLVEALLARKPLIASDAGGVREIVEDRRTALLVPPGDAAQLAQEIAAVREFPARAAAMAAAGSADVRHRFTRSAMTDGVAKVIDDLFEELHA
jgi:glycosyltransferase involved in cell wall biosynthesis